MDFSMRLLAEGPVPRAPDEGQFAYDEELDDVLSLLSDVCGVLASSREIRFVVTGFDRKPWPLDVETDLAVVLPQMPEVLESLRQGRDFSIHHYEQGVERCLNFRVGDDRFEIECVSSDPNWEPQPRTLSIRRQDLERMLHEFCQEFCRLAETACPALTGHPWFQEWRRGVLGLQK